MFKVECPGCKAPYQVDERRVPPSGLKMRCPKCGSSFQVEPPPADPRGTSPSPVLGASLGLDDPPSAPDVAARPPLPKKRPAPKGTMIGVAPPRVAAPPRPPAPAPDPTEFDIDLPAPAPPRVKDPPPAPAPPRAKEPSPEKDPFADLNDPRPGDGGDPFGSLDLPSPAPAGPARRIPTRALGTPGISPSSPTPTATRAPAREAQKTAPSQTAPVPAAYKTTPSRDVELEAARARIDPFEDLDLPAAPAQGGHASRTQPGHAGPFDLPSPAPSPSKTQPGHVAPFDLPSPAANVRGTPQARPAPRERFPGGDAELPMPGRGGAPPPKLSSKDFPAPKFDDLPSLGFGGDLPSPAGGMGLPSLSDGLDLPSISGGVDLSAGVGGGFGELDLPIMGGDLPSTAVGLPSPAAGLPSPAAGLPSPAAGLPSSAAGFPTVAAGLPEAVSEDPFGGGGSTTPFGEAPDPFGAAPDPFGAPEHAFGTPPGASSPPADPFGAPPQDDAGNEFSPRQEAPRAEAIVRQSGGGTAYGEVNLEDGGAATGVPIEGELPQANNAESGAEFDGLPSEGASSTGPAVSVARTRAGAAPGSAVAEIQSKKRKRRLRVVVAAVTAAALAGGALTLVPSVGPFGAYFIVDQVRRGEYERVLAATADAAHRAFGKDTYPDAASAMKLVTAAGAQARRYKPLVAYRSFVGFSRLLRFGGESEIYASAKVALEELADAGHVDKVDLAKAAKAGADGEIAKARQLLDELARAAPKDIDVVVVRGEVELKARNAAAALVAWKNAAQLEKSTRTSYGLARATLAAGDLPGAQKLAQDALAANPKHIGSRLLLAETSWSTNHDEARATKLLDEIFSNIASAGPEERVEAQTLLAEIHLDRGRMTQAEQSFGEAIKIAEMLKASARAARAMVGLGETLFRAGRYSQAIARFKTAAQADPDDLAAQVGVAKSSLELERIDDAKDMLGKLRKSYPKDMQVAYWYGKVQESLGERKEAETAYRDAITIGKDNPDSVQAYIALAGILSQNGQLDTANETLSEAQKRLPASPALHKALGRVAMTQGRYADGHAAFERALALDEDDVEARFLLGTAFSREHEFDKAIEIFEAVGKVDRDFPGLALERGMLYQESGRTEEALREYEAALAKAPTDPDLMLKVGCGKADAGNGTEAEKLLHKVLEQRPNSAETHFCLGRALMAKNDINDAIKAFERAVQIDANHAEYHLYEGWAYNEGGFSAKAAGALKKALELDQGLADAYWQRGVLRQHETRAKDAVLDLQKALQLRPSRVEAHADLARAYYDLGKEDLAIAEWQKAIAAKPNEATWRFNYGKLLSLRLENAAAAEQLKKAIELTEGKDGSFAWLSEAHRIAAMCLMPSPAAIPHWQAFLKTGALDSPFRKEAKLALKRLGAPWEDD